MKDKSATDILSTKIMWSQGLFLCKKKYIAKKYIFDPPKKNFQFKANFLCLLGHFYKYVDYF